jgi:hypothetical protein
MICKPCKAVGAKPHGSPVPHYCDACGFALTQDGQPVGRTASACLIRAEVEVKQAALHGEDLGNGQRVAIAEMRPAGGHLDLSKSGQEKVALAIIDRAASLLSWINEQPADEPAALVPERLGR